MLRENKQKEKNEMEQAGKKSKQASKHASKREESVTNSMIKSVCFLGDPLLASFARKSSRGPTKKCDCFLV